MCSKHNMNVKELVASSELRCEAIHTVGRNPGQREPFLQLGYWKCTECLSLNHTNQCVVCGCGDATFELYQALMTGKLD